MDAKKGIVLGSKGVNATGLIRSLGMAGVSVTFASNYSNIESKYTAAYLKLPDNMQLWLPILRNYCETLAEKPVVYPVDDATAYLLDDNYAEMSEFAVIPHAMGRMRELADKTVMAELAEKNGLTVAPFIKCGVDQLAEVQMAYPFIIKPFAAFAGGKGDIRICRTKDELSDAVQLLKEKNYQQVMVQKLLESKEQFEIGLMGCSFPDGRVIIPGTIKKIRSYPTGRGSTSYAQIVNGFCGLDIDKVHRFVRETGYVGIFDIEMIVSESTPYFIEINYRNGQYGFVPTKAGYNIPANWFCGLLGEAVEEPKKIEEVFYMNERDDYLHVKHGEISKKQWLKEFRAAAAFGMYCPGDQRPFIRQYVKIPDRVMIKIGKIKKKFTDFFVREEWVIAIRRRGDKLLFEDGGKAEAFTVIPNSFRYWCADPFVITAGAKDYIFFEMFDRFKGKGVIGYREIEQNGKIGKMHKAYESKNHLSFPFIFEHNGDYYMMPESSYDRNLTLLKASHFPDKWEVVKTWFEGEKICDSVLFKNNNDAVFLLTQPVEHPYTHAKLNLYSYQNGEWAPCKLNPVVDDRSAARMAGAVFIHNGGIIRPSQDCESYGDAVNFSRIDRVEAEAYEESLICRIRCSDLKLIESTNCYHGIHTYNSNDRYEVIDLKNKDTVRFGYLFSLINR